MFYKNSLLDFCDNFDYFIFDVWGVIHDGSNLYPNVLNVIKILKNQNKTICFLSNAPRRAKKVELVLEKFGIKKEYYEFILTSGEVAFIDFANGKNFFGRKYFYIGPEKDIDLLGELGYERVRQADFADFAITTGFDGDYSTIEEKMPEIISAKKHNLPLVCVNPDLIVVKQNGEEVICAGFIALEYEKLGGKVIYYGKPYEAVYSMVHSLLSYPKKEKIIAIGDGIETDIKGAVDFGIQSALVTGGILSNKLQTEYGEKADESKLYSICKNYNIFPNFVIPNL
jgi:HAD superfamily hydrolase (TIGR01459 family)